MLTLNRQPTTLANWDHTFYANLWRCASYRASAAAQAGHGDLAGREHETGNAMFALYESRIKPAFVPDCGENIVPDLHYDRLAIDRNKHIKSAMNSEPVALPSYLDETLCDEEDCWQEKLADWLKINDDANVSYSWHETTLTDNDLTGEITVTWFHHATAADYFYAPCYVMIGGSLYDLTSSNIADCGILETSIGWHVTDLQDEPLPDSCQTDKLLAGCSHNPTYMLECMLQGGSQPVWHWGFNCFVGRLEEFPHPVKLYPEPPYYGG